MRIVIIDDEKNFLEDMCGAVHWERLGYELAGTATDGTAGLELIFRERPDVILTDIRMPGMYGLDMIARAKEFLPESVFIVMSGYSEFAYCSRAIGLGVLDYLEKPISLERLTHCLLNASNVCALRKCNASLQEKNLHLKRQSMGYALERYLTGDNYEKIIRECDLNEEWKYFTAAREVLTLAIQPIDEAHDAAEYIEELKQYVSEWRPQIGVLSCTIQKTSIVVMYSLFESFDTQWLQEVLLSIGEDSLGEHCNVGISRVHYSIRDLEQAAGEANSALTYARYMDAGEPVPIEKVEYNDWILTDYSYNTNTVELNIRTQNYAEALNQIRRYLEQIGGMFISPKRFGHECLRAINMVLREGIESGFDYVTISRQIPHAELENCTGQRDMLEWTCTYLEEFFRQLSDVPAKNNVITRVVDYIQQHYAEGITLETLAEHVQMNSTYLSILFKNEMGITFVRYLRELRINKAVALLQQGYRAKEVCAMVGYRDYRYFSNCFREQTGKLPQEFRGTGSRHD